MSCYDALLGLLTETFCVPIISRLSVEFGRSMSCYDALLGLLTETFSGLIVAIGLRGRGLLDIVVYVVDFAEHGGEVFAPVF